MNQADSRLLEIRHVTVFEYHLAVQRATMLLRLEPRSDEQQQVLDFSYHIEPQATPVAIVDGFGNLCHLVDIQSLNQSSVVVTSSSQVQTFQPTNLAQDDALERRTDWSQSPDLVEHWEYLAYSNRVYACSELERFLTKHSIERLANPYRSIKETASIIYQNIRYEPGSTEVSSNIEDCLNQGSGVCQDFTHIMLAIGRSWGIPSRYVSGYLHLFPQDNAAISETASHAWAEFYFPELGWIGFDATNNTLVDNHYVRLSVGRDYDDVAPTRGVVFGGGSSTLNVKITLVQKNTDQSGAVQQ